MGSVSSGHDGHGVGGDASSVTVTVIVGESPAPTVKDRARRRSGESAGSAGSTTVIVYVPGSTFGKVNCRRSVVVVRDRGPVVRARERHVHARDGIAGRGLGEADPERSPEDDDMTDSPAAAVRRSRSGPG